MSYLNALDCDMGWIVVYTTYDEENWVGVSSSIWMVPGTLEG